MFSQNRWNPFDDLFSFQRNIDRFFDQFWNDLPTRRAAGRSPSFQVRATEDSWHIDVPMPGIDPGQVTLEAAGNTLTIRTEAQAEDADKMAGHDEQMLTVPHFLDLDRLSASHRHGLLRLTLPLKESIKPRRIKIEAQPEEQTQLIGAK